MVCKVYFHCVIFLKCHFDLVTVLLLNPPSDFLELLGCSPRALAWHVGPFGVWVGASQPLPSPLIPPHPPLQARCSPKVLAPVSMGLAFDTWGLRP